MFCYFYKITSVVVKPFKIVQHLINCCFLIQCHITKLKYIFLELCATNRHKWSVIVRCENQRMVFNFIFLTNKTL